MKHFKKIIATVLVAGGIFSVAGCSNGPIYSSTSTAANWNVATSTTVENNYKEFWRSHKEVASYSVNFKEGGNSTYKVEYYTADAATKYTTAFYMDKADYDWGSDTLPDGVKIVPEEGSAPKDAVYVYEVEYTLKGRYLFNATNETVEFENSVKTVCKYRLAGENLKPVYSNQEIKSTAPANLTPVSKDSMCVTIDAIYETYYNRDCTKAVVTVDDRTEANEDSTKTISLSGLTFDNSQLPFALRSFSLSGNKSFNVCSPQNGSTQGVMAVCNIATSLNSEDTSDKDIIEVLTSVKDGNGNDVDDYIFFDGTSSDPEEAAKQIRYHNVTIGINANMRGATPVYTYAAVENADINTTRAVLLKMTTPLSFGLGTLSYTIKGLSVESF